MFQIEKEAGCLFEHWVTLVSISIIRKVLHTHKHKHTDAHKHTHTVYACTNAS